MDRRTIQLEAANSQCVGEDCPILQQDLCAAREGGSDALLDYNRHAIESWGCGGAERIERGQDIFVRCGLFGVEVKL